MLTYLVSTLYWLSIYLCVQETAESIFRRDDNEGMEEGRPATYMGDDTPEGEEPTEGEEPPEGEEPDLPARPNLLANGKL